MSLRAESRTNENFDFAQSDKKKYNKMSKVVIKAENISKQYRLGLVGTGTVKDDLKRWWYNLRGKEDPFLKRIVLREMHRGVSLFCFFATD